MNAWRKEKDVILNLPIKGKDKIANQKRVNMFIVQSLDYLADPTFGDRKIPLEMFEISQIISIKIKGSYQSQSFHMFQRYATALSNNEKYNISIEA